MSTLDPRVRALVDAARAAEPSAADRARVRAALALRLAPVTSGGPETPPHPPVHPAPGMAASAGVGAKLLVTGLLVGAVGFGGGVVMARQHAPGVEMARHGAAVEAFRRAVVVERAVQAARPAPVGTVPVVEPPPEVAAPAPVLAPAEARPTPARSQAALPVAEPKASSLVEETDLLRKAQTELAAGDAAGALTQLDALAARHPDGQLREERLAAKVAALCAMGREDDARREAERLLADAPRSIHAARVRASCAFAPKGGGSER